LFSLDIVETKKETDLWTSNPSLPYWEAKRAGLLAEIGFLDEAQFILETSLKDIRSKLYLHSVKDDYSAISQEAYILQLLDYVRSSIRFSVQSAFGYDKRREEYLGRWKEITEYECDPWGELEQFESAMKQKQLPYKRVETSYKFDIGKQTKTEKWGNDIYTIKSYSLLKYMEYTGIPLRLPGTIMFGREAVGNALERIADYSPEWALVTLVRSGEEENIERLFDRKAMAKISREYADDLSISFLKILEKSVNEIRKSNSVFNRNFAVNLAIILPQILSHLCVKNSYDVKIRVLSFVKGVYLSDVRNNYADIAELTKR
jgi:hypothetical protein